MHLKYRCWFHFNLGRLSNCIVDGALTLMANLLQGPIMPEIFSGPTPFQYIRASKSLCPAPFKKGMVCLSCLFYSINFSPCLLRWPVRSVVRSPVSSVTLCRRRWRSSLPTRSASPSQRSSASQSRKLSATKRTSTARSFLLRLNFISVIAGKPDHKFYKTIKFTFYLHRCTLSSLD